MSDFFTTSKSDCSLKMLPYQTWPKILARRVMSIRTQL